MKMKSGITVKAGLALLAICGVVLFAKTTQQDEKGEKFREALHIEHAAPDRTGPLGGYSSVVDQVSPSVVSVYTEKKLQARESQSLRPFFDDPFFRRFFGEEFEFRSVPDDPGGQRQPTPREAPRQSGLGSGVVMTSDGYVLTNNHVVEGADEIKVRFPDQKRDYEASIVGRDAATDLAILKVDATGLQAAKLGDSSLLKVGDTVLAVGNPFGLNQTVTTGIVSALGRKNLNIASYENFIQTDASINPGNSGGALVDNQGRVIGINTAIVPRMGGGNVGIGFAIPINLAIEVAEGLIENGEIRRGYLGVMLSDVSEDLAQAFHTKAVGALVNEVLPGTPAERAGMKSGDIVIRYDGKAVEDMAQLRLLVAGTDPEQETDVVVLRDGEEKTLRVKLGKLSESEVAQTNQPGEATQFLEGVRIRTLDDELRKRYGLKEGRSGAVVVEVDPNSKAAYAGLREGFLIVEIAREPVESADDAARLFEREREKPDARVLLLRVETENGSRFLAVEFKK